jgi:hypothetical protein
LLRRRRTEFETRNWKFENTHSRFLDTFQRTPRRIRGMWFRFPL